MAILAAMTVQATEADTPDRLKSASEVMIADIIFLRELAVTNNSQYQIEFDVDINSIVIRHTGTNSAFDVLPDSPFMTANKTGTEYSYVIGGSGIGVPPNLVVVQDISGNTFTDVDFGPLGETVNRNVVTRIWFGCGHGAARRYIYVDINPITGLAKIGDIQVKSPIIAFERLSL
jgi:hypothetical protein